MHGGGAKLEEGRRHMNGGAATVSEQTQSRRRTQRERKARKVGRNRGQMDAPARLLHRRGLLHHVHAPRHPARAPSRHHPRQPRRRAAETPGKAAEPAHPSHHPGHTRQAAAHSHLRQLLILPLHLGCEMSFGVVAAMVGRRKGGNGKKRERVPVRESQLKRRRWAQLSFLPLPPHTRHRAHMGKAAHKRGGSYRLQ